MGARLLSFLTIALLAALRCLGGNNDSWGSDDKPVRPVTSAWTAGIGTGQLADTYLTPLKYSGLSMALDYERWQAMRFNPERWVMRLDIEGVGVRGKSPSGNATMWDVSAKASWGMLHRWQLESYKPLTLLLGGSTTLDLGAMIERRNSNNPVAAKCAWTVNVTGAALWHTRLARRPVTLRWQPTLALAGMCFSQQYGELYYEIYLGNHSGLVHAAFPWQRLYFESLLTADWRLGATALRLGYRTEVMEQEVCHIVTRRIVHIFTLGVSLESLSINPNYPLRKNAPVISAYY